MTDLEKDFRALRRKLARWLESDWRAALRRDAPRDRYAVWCAERIGVKLPYIERQPDFKIAFEPRAGSLDDIAIFYVGETPGSYWEYRGASRFRRERDHYEGEIARVIIPAARWEPGEVVESREATA